MSNNSQSGGGTGSSGGSPIRDLKMLANGRYRLMQQVGRGGMSVVYHAYDTLNDRDVAIKILSLDLVLEENFLARFRRESELMRDMNHPHILRAYDFGQEGEIIYLVMSYYGGGTLKERINGPLPLRTIADYLTQVAAGLGYAHSRNIVHRDVKPSNILVHHASESLVLSDFGIAKALSGSNLQLTGTIMGTPLYMAPEQFLDRVDLRTDIYALGIVLYQMLTGEVPFKGEGIGFKHLNDPVPPLAAFGLNYDPVIEHIVTKALAKRPDDRYQKVEEFAQAFNQAVRVYGESQTGRLNLNTKPTLLSRNESNASADWAERVKQPALPGQANFSALPVLEPNPATPPVPAYNPPIYPPANFNQVSYSPRSNYNDKPIANNYYNPPVAPPIYGEIAYTPTGGQRVEHSGAGKRGARWLILSLIAILVLGLAVIGAGALLLLTRQPVATATPTALPTTVITTLNGPIIAPVVTAAPAVLQTATASSPNNVTPPVPNAPKLNFKLLYVSQITTNTEAIFSYDPLVGASTALTKIITGTQDTNPVWAVNGQTIIFQSDRDGGKAGIYAMAASGLAQTLIVAAAYSPAVSHGGNDIVYVSTNDNNLYLTSLTDASTRQQLTFDTTHKKFGAAFSPGNDKITYSMEDDRHIYQLYMLDIANPKISNHQILQCATEHCTYPVFSPDGTKIAYGTAKVNPANDEDRLPLDIYVINLNGKPSQRQLTANSGHNSRPAWVQDNRGLDGTRIYFNSDRGANNRARIYTMNVDGSGQTLLVDDVIKASNGNSQEAPVEDFAPAVLLLGS